MNNLRISLLLIIISAWTAQIRGQDEGVTSLPQFLKIFSGRENELKSFIKKNKIRFDKREHLVRLVQYCNS